MRSGKPHRVVLQGFSAFERSALSSYFRLAAGRIPSYEQVDGMDGAQFIIADADHPGVIGMVLEAGRAADTVFIGSEAPDGAMAWMMRPIDPLHVLRELDATLALREPQGEGVPLQPPHARHALEAPPSGACMPSRRAGDSPVIAPRPPRPRAPDVLMVGEDLATLRQIEALGLRTERALDSERALQLLSARGFGFVFIDRELGDDSEIDGLSLCRHIKQRQRHSHGPAPVVVMLAPTVEPADRVRGTLAGCDAFLAQPANEAALRSTLEAHGATLAPQAGRG
jgi:CheY-like chemotaxis protein